MPIASAISLATGVVSRGSWMEAPLPEESSVRSRMMRRIVWPAAAIGGGGGGRVGQRHPDDAPTSGKTG
ncbi:hypothetical protein GCM10010178_04750 [Lentzea flava]|uniref:Uncharacterized protein n=1 Tax=Lentzea flava TaxID=103732 RepID=A0ABQ2UBV8_9PSEU|nr:hypothetical protein GCM10010178_04750 [Lentzea flava]